MAEGRTVFILNADVHIRPLAVSQLESYLLRLDKAVIVGPQGSHLDLKNLSIIRYFKRGAFDEPVQVHDVSGFLFAIHLERFLKHHLMFDVQFSPCFFEELDMGLQVLQAGLACYIVPVKDFEHRWGASHNNNENFSINYFGKEVTRKEILTKNRERFVAKWLSGMKDKTPSSSVGLNDVAHTLS
jgi:GT2 family glycosyltransferase